MAEENDKEKKLKEIQQRLAEIQGKTRQPTPKAVHKETSTPPISEPEPNKKEKKESAVPPVQAKKPKESQTEPKREALKPKPTKVEVKPSVEAPREATAEKGWSQNTVKEKEPKAVKANKPPKSPGAKNSKRSKILSIVSLSITILVASYIAYTYLLEGGVEEAEVIEAAMPETDNLVTETPEAEEINDDAAMNVSETEQIQDQQSSSEESKSRVNEKRKERKEEIKNEAKEETVPEVSMVKGPVPSGIIISYSSNSSEDIAGKNVRFLNSKGLKANYYYMPDKDAGSPSLYKVYVGPYKDESQAMSDFRKVVGFNDKAFLLRMN